MALQYSAKWKVFADKLSKMQIFDIKDTELTDKKVLSSKGGSGSRVLSAKYKNETVVCKELTLHMPDDFPKDFFNELLVLKQMKDHKSIPKVYGCYFTPINNETMKEVTVAIGIVLRFYEGGDLADFLFKNKNIHNNIKLKIAVDVAEALEYLHQNKIYHLDMKPEQILINPALATGKGGSMSYAVLNDYGLTRTPILERIVNNNQKVVSLATGPLGTPAYIAPEFNERKTAPTADGGKVDVWGFGYVLWILWLSGKDKYDDLNDPKKHPGGGVPPSFDVVLKMPAKPTTKDNEEFMPPALFDLMVKCFSKDPKARPNMTECVALLKKEYGHWVS